jgi:hypothetical protein
MAIGLAPSALDLSLAVAVRSARPRFLLPSLPIAVVAFAVTLTLFSAGLSLAIVWIGVPIAFAALCCARAFGDFELYRLDVARQAPVARPIWPISH